MMATMWQVPAVKDAMQQKMHAWQALLCCWQWLLLTDASLVGKQLRNWRAPA
jgi:hypothetical protein